MSWADVRHHYDDPDLIPCPNSSRRNRMKIQHPWPPYSPQMPPVAKMCETCPFQPHGNGHGADHPDFRKGGDILTRIELGLPFPCHQTALFNPGTKRDRQGNPHPGQSHFRHCLGAVLYKRGEVHSPGTDPSRGSPT